MSNLDRRLKRAEGKLNLDRKPLIVNIVCFAGDLPSDRQVGNMTIHYVQYDEKAEQ